VTRVILIVRHAHRHLKNRSKDNGLSAKGKHQARRLLERYKKSLGKSPSPVLLSSPKRRCVETLKPLARWSGAEIQTDPRLLERGLLERPSRFQARLFGVLGDLARAKPPVAVLSVHGDGAPVLLKKLTGARAWLKKGAWAQVEWPGPRLTHLLQKP
jgi:broad specificity phosphatase PhoE